MISIWIGTYIPMSEIYNRKTIKEIIGCIGNEFILKLHGIIDKIGKGIACGTIIMIIAFFIVNYFIKRIRKYKKLKISRKQENYNGGLFDI